MTTSEKGSLKQKTFSIEWKIERFFADCTEIGSSYESPSFPITYAGKTTWWFLEIYPMGEMNKDNKDYVSLFLHFQSDTDCEILVDYHFSVVSKIKSLSEECKAKTFKGGNDNWGENYFVEHSVLKDTSNGALINDTLTILCKITFHSTSQDVSERFHCYDAWLDAIPKNFYEDTNLFGMASDVTLNIKDKQMYLHKSILMQRNSVFKAMFEHKMKEKEENLVNITDIDYNVMKELFRFIYLGKVENIKEIAKDLLIAADKYSVVELKALCEQTLFDNLTIDNAVDCLKLTDTYQTLYLKKLAIKFVVDNVKNIISKCDFKLLFAELSPEVVREIMEAVAEKV